MSSTPWTPDDDEARRLLDDRIDSYDLNPDLLNLWQRFIRWLNDALSMNVDPSGVGSFVLQALLVVAVGVLLFVLIRYFRPSVSPDAAADQDALVDAAISAQQYFQNAQRYLASGDLAQAYIHAYRFMVRHAQQRGLTEVTPSTTATSFGWSLGAVLPSYRDAIHQASTQFNQIVYGSSTPTQDAANTMMQLAHTIQTAQPQASDPRHDPARLVPR